MHQWLNLKLTFKQNINDKGNVQMTRTYEKIVSNQVHTPNLLSSVSSIT